jgi:hypothetical protein
MTGVGRTDASKLGSLWPNHWASRGGVKRKHKESIMGSATVENFSNGPVFVAIAHERGNFISGGWTEIPTNQTSTFTADDPSDLYLRVQGSDGNEITFSNFNTFLFFTTNPQRFTVNRQPQDPSVMTLQWGPNLENSFNMTAGEPLPAGWSSLRYFEIGSGNDTL